MAGQPLHQEMMIRTELEVQAAIATAAELRVLHAAVASPRAASAGTIIKYPPPTPPAPHHHSPHLSAHDYPVFTPSYEDGEPPLSSYRHIQSEPRAMSLSECWDEYSLGGNAYGHSIMSDFKMVSASARRNSLPSELSQRLFVEDNHKSVANIIGKSKRRNNLVADINPLVSKNNKNSNIVVPLTDSHASGNAQTKNRGLSLNFTRLLPKMMRKKKEKDEFASNLTDLENSSHPLVEVLKKELMEANESRDAALNELAGMSSSLIELKQKLEYLESYCEDLKKALKQAIQSNSGDQQHLDNSPMPVTEEVMVEGFMQIVSETRLSIRQFCKNLIGHIDESDLSLIENLNSLLQPYKLSITQKHSKAVLHHFEAIINQALFQDFENTVFQKNGATQHLDPNQDRSANFSSFVSLRNLSWNEVLMKGTKYYSEELSKFCDQKMNCILTKLNWTRLWPEQVLQSFFVAAKCVRLLHLLAFSFSKPIGIFRVGDNRSFDSNFMEDVLFADNKKQQQRSSKVKVMVMPGFFVQDKILKCKVLCKYKTVP